MLQTIHKNMISLTSNWLFNFFWYQYLFTKSISVTKFELICLSKIIFLNYQWQKKVLFENVWGFNGIFVCFIRWQEKRNWHSSSFSLCNSPIIKPWRFNQTTAIFTKYYFCKWSWEKKEQNVYHSRSTFNSPTKFETIQYPLEKRNTYILHGRTYKTLRKVREPGKPWREKQDKKINKKDWNILAKNAQKTFKITKVVRN